jgi:hypothetical protein
MTALAGRQHAEEDRVHHRDVVARDHVRGGTSMGSCGGSITFTILSMNGMRSTIRTAVAPGLKIALVRAAELKITPLVLAQDAERGEEDVEQDDRDRDDAEEELDASMCGS